MSLHKPLPEALLASMVEAIESGSAMPAMPSGLSVSQAYAVQAQLSQRLRGGRLGGIKAGLTQRAMQQHFGLSAAVLGQLYAAGRLSTGCQFPARPGLLLEAEVGVLLDDAGRVELVLPVIEIVQLGFSRDSDICVANIIAANLGADRYICGEPLPWSAEMEQAPIRMLRDGELVMSASSSDSLSGPSQGAAWIYAEAQRQQLPCAAGTLAILGTCGSAMPALAGSYQVDFGALGQLDFVIT